MIDEKYIYEKFYEVSNIKGISDEEKRKLFMSLLHNGLKVSNRQVGLEGLRQYLLDGKIKINDHDGISYLLSDLYGIFLADNSFCFAVDSDYGGKRGLVRCEYYAPIVFCDSIVWCSREKFRTIADGEGIAFSIFDVVPMELLMGSIRIKSRDLVFLEKKIKEFMKDNSGLRDNLFYDKRIVKIHR